MEKENRNKLIQIIVSAVLLAAAYIVGHFVSLPLWAQLLTYLPAYAVVGYEVIIEAFEGITEGEVFGEEFLMTIATVGALVIGFLPDSGHLASPLCIGIFYHFFPLISSWRCIK